MSEFKGEVKTLWLKNPKADRKMQLLEDFSFIDSEGKTWTSVKGSIVDGASIPKYLWTIGGSPFSGNYRRASVIHDTECKLKERPHKDVHKVFYEMMLEDHVPKWKAKLMYNMVRTFGPKWKLKS